MKRTAWVAAALVGFASIGSTPDAQAQSAAGPRRSGHSEMSPSLQALQRDAGLNPAWLWIDRGRERWGQSCRTCHGEIEQLASSAARHPRWNAALARPVRLTEQIQACRHRAGGNPGIVSGSSTVPNAGAAMSSPGPDSETLALATALIAAADGAPIRPDASSAMRAWQARGAELWGLRMGQLNLSCAHCHDQRAGQRLGGTPIPQGLDTGYPLYRMEWQGVGTLERRIRGCMTGVRAEPYAEDSDALRALEVFLRARAAGLPLEAAALRP